MHSHENGIFPPTHRPSASRAREMHRWSCTVETECGAYCLPCSGLGLDARNIIREKYSMGNGFMIAYTVCEAFERNYIFGAKGSCLVDACRGPRCEHWTAIISHYAESCTDDGLICSRAAYTARYHSIAVTCAGMMQCAMQPMLEALTKFRLTFAADGTATRQPHHEHYIVRLVYRCAQTHRVYERDEQWNGGTDAQMESVEFVSRFGGDSEMWNMKVVVVWQHRTPNLTCRLYSKLMHGWL